MAAQRRFRIFVAEADGRRRAEWAAVPLAGEQTVARRVGSPSSRPPSGARRLEASSEQHHSLDTATPATHASPAVPARPSLTQDGTRGAHDPRGRNLLSVALLIGVTLFTAFHEGYFPFVTVPFAAAVLASFAVAIWLALRFSSARLPALILGIFLIEYAKETIGVRAGMWRYHGVAGAYNFGVWLWVLGGITAFTLATQVLVKLLRRLSAPRWANSILLLLVAASLPLTLGSYWSGAGTLFWSFYALVAIIGLWVSAKMEFPLLASLVLSAWIVGAPSEYAGSISSRAWTFTHDTSFPPFFLLCSCWPLEILAQYALSAFLAGEPLGYSTGGTR